MSISVRILKKSAHARDDQSIITSFQLRYPRMIHAECKTHRVLNIDDAEVELLQEISLMDDENLSRNGSSSRAVPVERIIMEVLKDPAMPVSFGKNQKGMQAFEDLNQEDARHAKQIWLKAAQDAVFHARRMVDLGVHKQVINRILEPFSHISVIVTSTAWANFFKLRCHPAADPTMKALADAMFFEYCAIQPTVRDHHLPYTDDALLVGASDKQIHDLKVQDAAMCARVSYLTHDGQTPSEVSNMALGKMLLDQKHMSPFEHQASGSALDGSRQHLWGNFTLWDQFRKEIE